MISICLLFILTFLIENSFSCFPTATEWTPLPLVTTTYYCSNIQRCLKLTQIQSFTTWYCASVLRTAASELRVSCTESVTLGGRQRRLPSYEYFRQMTLRLHSTGSFHITRSEGRPTPRETHDETQILQHFEENPRTSTRRAAAVFSVNHMVIWRTFHGDSQHPFHFQRTQELLPADYSRREDFCRWWLSQVASDPSFELKVLWTDEATFTRNGIANLHYEHILIHTRQLKHTSNINGK